MRRGVSIRNRGFSLVELVMIIVVLSLGAAGLTTLYGQLGGSVEVTADVGIAAQVAQGCAEHVLAQRRTNTSVGYTGIASGMCAGLGFGGFTVTDVATVYSGTGCPGGAQCKQVVVTAFEGAVARSRLNLIVVNY